MAKVKVDFRAARKEFAKKYMQPPYNVNSVGTATDDDGNQAIGYSLARPLDRGVKIPKTFRGYKTRLGSIGAIVAQ